MAGDGRKLAIAAALSAFAFAAPAKAQDPAASLAQDLTNCAGAIAAHANIDVLTYPRGASGAWADVLGGIIDAMNREEGVQGMSGRYAASAARAYWAEQPSATREAAANECRARFGRG
ncbi:MAG TPA: hypothetical protein VM915_10140 [Verrucomicrobiae bacterium]|nr:hypothetical protein [Verrucomicrobiae bacterium]